MKDTLAPDPLEVVKLLNSEKVLKSDEVIRTGLSWVEPGYAFAQGMPFAIQTHGATEFK